MTIPAVYAPEKGYFMGVPNTRLKAKRNKNQIDMLIQQKRYETECLILLKKIMESGDCNACAASKECGYKPKLGELVRYNCPFYKDKKVAVVEEKFGKVEKGD